VQEREGYLRQSILWTNLNSEIWSRLQQNIVDTAVGEWRK